MVAGKPVLINFDKEEVAKKEIDHS